MRSPILLAAALSLAGAVSQAGEPVVTPISVNSHNRSSVDVYLLCGDRDAQWLGVVPARESGMFEARPRARAASKDSTSSWSTVRLTVEPYAGLSYARVENRPR